TVAGAAARDTAAALAANDEASLNDLWEYKHALRTVQDAFWNCLIGSIHNFFENFGSFVRLLNWFLQFLRVLRPCKRWQRKQQADNHYEVFIRVLHCQLLCLFSRVTSPDILSLTFDSRRFQKR